MIPKIVKYPQLIAATMSLLLAACGGSVSGNQAWDGAVANSHQNLQQVESEDAVEMPILRSKKFAAKWGKPKVEVNGSGGYVMSYSDPKTPFNRLVIYGSQKAFPELLTPPKLKSSEMVNGELATVERPQLWRPIMIAGGKGVYCKESTGGGADGTYYITSGFSRTAPDGRVGYYRIVVEAGDNESAVVDRISSVGF